MIDVIEIISGLQQQKREKNITPDHVLFPDLKNAFQDELKKELNRLVRERKIGVSNTLNSKAVYLKDEDCKRLSDQRENLQKIWQEDQRNKE